uniref:hypothetical protein n=1 Tax=Nonomuraea sp. CA-251285 TaxID=3240002 RepID=UPI003F49B2E7
MGLRLEYKASGATATAAESGVLEADNQTGIVEAIVSVTGVVDEDNDEILPGAYAETLKKRMPKGIFHHDWRRWVARTLDIKELPPGDPHLPKTTRSGDPWPTGAGALWVKAQFNLGTTEGKEAFSNIEFFSDETEWSIGYKVKPGNARKTPQGVRRIKAVDLYEYSPVLFGAAPLSGTLSVKELTGTDEDEDLDESEVEGEPGDDQDANEALLHDASDAVIDGDEEPPEDALLLPDENEAEEETTPAEEDGPPEAPPVPPGMSLLDLVEDEPREAKAAMPLIDLEMLRQVAEEERRHRGAGLEVKAGAPGVADTPGDAASVERLKSWYVRGEGAAKIRWGQPGDFMRCVRLAGKHMTPDKAKAFCANRHKEALGAWPGREGDKDKKDLYDPALEVGGDAGYLDPDDPDGLQTKMLQLPGTLEDLRDKLRQAVDERFRSPAEATPAPPSTETDSWVCIEGTWVDRVVVTHEHGGERDSYSIPYTLTPAGDVLLGNTEPVTITVTPVITPAAVGASLGEKADQLEHLTRSLQRDLDALQTKAAGPVGEAHERRLRSLLGVLTTTLGHSPPGQIEQKAGAGTVPLSGDLFARHRSLSQFARTQAGRS